MLKRILHIRSWQSKSFWIQPYKTKPKITRNGTLESELQILTGKQATNIIIKGLSKFWKLLNIWGGEAGIDHVPRLGAALAFYSLFSIGPTFLILATIATNFYGKAIQEELISDLSGYIGQSGAEVISQMISASTVTGQTVPAFVIGLAGFLFAAGAAYRSLEDAMNTIFHVRRAPQLVVFVGAKKLFLSTTYAIGFGSILAFALFARTFAIDLYDKVSRTYTTQGVNVVGGILTFITLLLVLSFVFRFISGARPKWRDVLIGACVSAVFVMLGQAALQWYLASGQAGSLIGAAGSIVFVMIWVYYTSQIVLLGAVLVKALALLREETIPIRNNYVRMKPVMEPCENKN